MKDFYMLIRTKSSNLSFFLLTCLFSLGSLSSLAADSVKLYTPYMVISVSPGETINYSIDIINNGNEIENVNISVAGMPGGWGYIIKSGGWYVKQLSILPVVQF